PSESLLDRSKIGDSQSKSISTMPEMVQFVFEFYQQTVTRMQQERPEEFQRIVAGAGAKPEESEEAEAEMEQEPKEEENSEDAETQDQDEEMPFEPLGENDQALDDEIELPSDEEETE